MTPLQETKILVIDDDESIRDLLVMCLGDEGYTVVAPKDMSEAKAEVAKKEAYKVILHDVILWGGHRGVDLMQELRDNNPQALLIALTAIADGANEDVKAICNTIAPKPFNLNDLLSTIKIEVSQRGRRRILNPPLVQFILGLLGLGVLLYQVLDQVLSFDFSFIAFAI